MNLTEDHSLYDVVFALNRPAFDEISVFPGRFLNKIAAVVIRVFDNLPEKVLNFILKIRFFATLSQIAQKVKFRQRQLICRRLHHLAKEKLYLRLLEVNARLLNDLDDFRLILRCGQRPEHLEQRCVHFSFLQEKLENVGRPLHKLQVRVTAVPDLVESVILDHPLDQKVGAKRRRV